MPEAQFNLSVMYKAGEVVQPDTVEAVYWAREAAERGHVDAAYNLGTWFGRGDGIPDDQAIAFEYYLKAAKGGKDNARAIVGLRYLDGDGVAEDRVRGLAWLLLVESEGVRPYVEAAEAKLSNSEIRASEQLALKCKTSRYQDC